MLAASRARDGCRGPSTGCQAPHVKAATPAHTHLITGGRGEGSGHGKMGCEGMNAGLFLKGALLDVVVGWWQEAGRRVDRVRRREEYAQRSRDFDEAHVARGCPHDCEAPAQFVRTGRWQCQYLLDRSENLGRTPTSVRIGVQPNQHLSRLARYQGVCAFSAPSARRDITISQVGSA